MYVYSFARYRRAVSHTPASVIAVVPWCVRAFMDRELGDTVQALVVLLRPQDIDHCLHTHPSFVIRHEASSVQVRSNHTSVGLHCFMILLPWLLQRSDSAAAWCTSLHSSVQVGVSATGTRPPVACIPETRQQYSALGISASFVQQAVAAGQLCSLAQHHLMQPQLLYQQCHPHATLSPRRYMYTGVLVHVPPLF
jgi:hypothetical protein